MKCHDEEMGPDRKLEVAVDDDDDMECGNQLDAYDDHEYSDEGEDFARETDDDDGCNSTYSDEYTTAWPQSYRPSIDMMSSVASPKMVEFIGGSSLTILGHSFLRPSSPPPHSEDTLAAHLLAETDAASPLHPSPRLPVSSTLSKCSSARRSFLSCHGLPQAPSGSSFSQAVINGINVLCGVGILTLPYAMKSGGWFGLVVLLGFGLISCYTGVLLKRCLDSSPGLRTYPDIGQAAFGAPGRYSIATILYMELYASCVEYIILVSDNLSTMFPDASVHVAGRYLGSHQLFAATTALAVLPTVLLRDLSLLSYLSAGGVIASVVVVFSLFWIGTVDGIGLHPAGSVLDLTNLPVAIGLYGFCFSGHSVFPNIYSSMKKKSEFPAVLFVCFVSCTLVYAGVATVGLLMFGDSIESQFTLNMPPQFVASKVAVWTTVVNPLTKYALTITPVALSLEELLPESQMESHSMSVFIRTTLVISTLLVALVVPFFGFVMALVGSSLTMLVALILPCACYLSIQRRTVGKLQAMVCINIALLGVVCACIGTFTTIKRMVSS